MRRSLFLSYLKILKHASRGLSAIITNKTIFLWVKVNIPT